MNFQNIFNRLQMQNPTGTNILAPTTRNVDGKLTGGFGFINYVGGRRFSLHDRARSRCGSSSSYS
jgi:hypothetical protein